MMWTVVTQLKLAARSLAKRPGYAVVAAFTLALGIGANVAIFTVVNGVLLRPLPYPGADRIVAVRHHAPGLKLPQLQSSPGLIEFYRESAPALAQVAAIERLERNLTGSGRPERVRGIAVTPEIFDVLAVRPERGRPFSNADAQRGAPLVTILTHAMWQSQFGSDPDVLGRQVKLDGKPAQIVGVMPAHFAFPDPETRLLIPLWLDAERGFGAFGTTMLARLAPDVTVEQARRELHDLQQRIPERFPEITSALLDRFGWSVSLQTLRDDVVREVSRPLWLLLGTVGLVLLIAGANVANLFLIRAESRRREVAIRLALGASRGHIAGTFLSESLLLSLAGGTAGAVMAAAGIRALVAHGPAELPRLHEVSVDGVVLLFTAALSLLAGLVLGILPVVGSARRSLTTPLHDGGRGTTHGRHQHRVRRLLIAGQVAAAVVILVAAGLILRSVVRLSSVDPGFKTDGLLTAGVSLGAEPDRARASMFYHRVLDEVAAISGVLSVGATTSLPIEATRLSGSNFAIESHPRADDAIPPVAMYTAVTAGYFETLMIPLRAGRALVRADAEQGRSVVWVNENFARQFLDDRAVGQRIRIGEDTKWLDIAGVVGDVRTFGLREDIRPMVYLPLSTSMPNVGLDVAQVVVRTRGRPASLAPALRAAVYRVNPSVPLTTVKTMEDIVASSLAQISFTMTLLVIAAVVALVLGIVGLYGAISYVVTQRTSEIGVRLALGARPGDVRAMVLRQGLSVALVGIIVGLIAALAVANIMASLLFEVPARDPITYGTVALVLTAVSALASYFPARKAAGIDPARALREEG